MHVWSTFQLDSSLAQANAFPIRVRAALDAASRKTTPGSLTIVSQNMLMLFRMLLLYSPTPNNPAAGSPGHRLVTMLVIEDSRG